MSSAKRKRPDTFTEEDLADSSGKTLEIYRSEEIVDRQSTFVGLFSPTISPQELQKLEEISSAGHKILGWRRESNQQSLTAAKKYVSGHDDDGEKYGGKKVEQCLVNANVTGACVVARWYGGVMLGPVRFTHMESCALGAIQKWRDSVAEQLLKKRRIEDEAKEKERLVKVLAARDQSITVLRTLAVEKEQKASTLTTQETVPSTTTQQTKPLEPASSPLISSPDYQQMSVKRLQALEKARDATLSFLLKRIDKAESKLQETNVADEEVETKQVVEAGD